MKTNAQGLPMNFIILLVLAIVVFAVVAIMVISGQSKADGSPFFDAGKNQSHEGSISIQLSTATNDCTTKCNLAQIATNGKAESRCSVLVKNVGFCNVYNIGTEQKFCTGLIEPCELVLRDAFDNQVTKTLGCTGPGGDTICT